MAPYVTRPKITNTYIVMSYGSVPNNKTKEPIHIQYRRILRLPTHITNAKTNAENKRLER